MIVTNWGPNKENGYSVLSIRNGTHSTSIYLGCECPSCEDARRLVGWTEDHENWALGLPQNGEPHEYPGPEPKAEENRKPDLTFGGVPFYFDTDKDRVVTVAGLSPRAQAILTFPEGFNPQDDEPVSNLDELIADAQLVAQKHRLLPKPEPTFIESQRAKRKGWGRVIL